MAELSAEDRALLVQHMIARHGDEASVTARLAAIMPERDVQGSIDMLIGTQRVRRIGPDRLENNESHTELEELSDRLRALADGL